MASIVSAGTTSATALNMSADTSGVLQLASNNGTVALTVDTSQNIQIGTTTVAAALTDVLTVGKNSTSYDASIVIRQFGNGTAAQLQLIAANDTGATYNSISSTTSGGTQHWKLGGTGGAAGALPIFTSGTERVRITAAGLFQYNNGYGSVATVYGCRAWARITGGGGSGGLPATGIDAGGNASSLVRNSTGNYTLNFTNSMPDTNYAFSGNQETGNITFVCLIISYNQYTTGVNFITLNNGTQSDFRYGSVAIFR
jgi:hypothetical protein